MKSEIIERLGQTEILLPSLIAAGLEANDRVKVRLSVVQAAVRRTRNPRAEFELGPEARAAGVDPVAMANLVSRASAVGGDQVTAPGLDDLVASIWDDTARMIRAARAGDAAMGDAMAARLAAIKKSAPSETSDMLALSWVGRLTEVSGSGDSLHRLVMDLHQVLLRMSADRAEELLAGAHVYGVASDDRLAVEAFMRGVAETSRLKFGHPGLGTTALRSEKRLMIQNDIGETDAHVIVISVDPGAVTITHTDIHRSRARFFTNLLRDFHVQWSGLDRTGTDGPGENPTFYLVTGRCVVEDAKARDAFLEAVGRSLVFLIDWNKARKVLRSWVSNADAIQILDWAARNRIGHRGFLEMGGVELVASAVRHATPARIGFGEGLDTALGREAAVDFLKTVLRVCTEVLLEGSSVRLARDRIEADLVRHLERIDAPLLAIVIRQAGLAREIAVGISDFIAQRDWKPHGGAMLAARARRIEEKADRIAIEARSEIRRLDADRSLERLVNSIEDAIDDLEQAAFLVSLMPTRLDPLLLVPLADLCAAAITGAEAAAVGVAAAAEVPERQRADVEDVLAAVSRLIDAEHKADADERAVTSIVLRGQFDLQTALGALDLARAIERATDRLAGFGHLLREHVLADLFA